MARDENDRPYEDGQGRSLNPELTGDVLSPRWSTDDTDEQPAIQVVGNETYILPPDKGTLAGEPQLLGDGMRDVLDDGPMSSHDLLSGHSGAHDLGVGSHDPLGGHSGAHDILGDPGGSHHDPLDASYELDTSYETRAEHSGPHQVAEGASYLPLDQGYDGPYEEREEEPAPKRGFLGSGWTDDANDDHRSAGSDREVRRRTRKLLVAAVAVVLVGVGAGFMLTGTSSDDPCAGGRCASAGEVTSPSDSAAPEDTPAEEEVPAEPTDSTTAEPTDNEPVNSTSRPERARPSREPSAKPTRTRIGEPTAKSSSRPTREPSEIQDTEPEVDQPSSKSESSKQPNPQPSAQPTTQAPAQTQAPAPTPTQEEKKGLLDILFPWA